MVSDKKLSLFFRLERGKDQESIQSSTTPDPGYQWESDNFTRTSDGGNGNNSHCVSLPIILIKIKVDQMLPSSYKSSL